MDTSVIVTGLSFPEAPRWREGLLYFVDMGTGAVLSLDPHTRETSLRVPKVPGRPSGLAWDQEGRLMVVSMGRSCLYVDAGLDRLSLVADLSGVPGGWRNDAVGHPNGWTYVGATGRPADLVAVDQHGTVQIVARDIGAPNGMVVTPGGETLIVAEFAAERLIAFTVHPDGSLSDQRIWAALPRGCTPDGICLDRSGAVWLAWADTDQVLRVREGDSIEQAVTTSQPAFACMLGGIDRRSLYICSAPGLARGGSPETPGLYRDDRGGRAGSRPSPLVPLPRTPAGY